MEKHKVSWKDLRAASARKYLPETTEKVSPSEGIIGQERASRAIEFGLRIKNSGYNIYVAGYSGTGRTTSVETAVKKIAEKLAVPNDWCYVYNFSHPDQPKAIKFPPGKASVFKVDIDNLVEEFKVEIPKAFESKIYEEHRNRIVKNFQRKKDEMFGPVEEAARQAGFQIKQTPSGISFTPTVEGKPLTEEEMEKLTEEAREDFKNRQEILYEQLSDVLRKIRDEEKKAKESLDKLEKETALFTIKPRLNELKEKYQAHSEVISYLDALEKDVVENVGDFQEKREIEILPGLKMPTRESALLRYQVNVFVDNSRTKGAPVVKELNPTSYNLAGRIEYRPQLGAMVTDYTMMKPGALHTANGGFLILQAVDVLRNYFSWEVLKRAIKNQELVIEDINEQFRLINTPTLKPEPIPADLKVILIGNPLLYYLLYQYDEDFRKLFKVRADFSSLMDRHKEGVANYAAFISRICRDENLKHFDREAIEETIQYGSRMAEDQGKLTTRFIDIADLIRESSFYAATEGAELVSGLHVKKALQEKIYRSNLIEKRLEELIKEGTIMVDTDGEKVGQINGLSVLVLGDYSFGKPSRITARVYTGKRGMINIDREVKLSGTIHNKGFLILSGYLGEKYGTNQPLAFSASLCFEQVYEEIEGDSASSAELYALLSALAGVPLKQYIAVTGSVNQKGEVQPVGGINEKIEGFYYTCKAKGLTGKQGVIIPVQNKKNLMLNDEVVAAVQKRKFTIWAVRNIDEGLEILTGLPAGKEKKDGTYPAGTIHHLVARRLGEFMQALMKYEKRPGRNQLPRVRNPRHERIQG